jgi:hypothetical protein
MKLRERKFLRFCLCWACAVLAVSLAYAQAPDNGIAVNGIKVYDNAALQQMLDNARARLAGMNFLDASGIASRIGGIQGSTMQQTGFSVNVGGPPIAGLQTTANTGNTVTTQNQGTTSTNNSGTSNNQTQSTTGAASGPTSSNQLTVTLPTTSSGTTGNNQSVATGPSTQTVASLAQQNPSAAALPTPNSYTAPSTFAPSASNILNEQVQLTSEVAELALLLEGALSDQAVQTTLSSGGVLTLPKRRVTIGIPVTIVPSDKDKDAVAEVIVTITPTAGGMFHDVPAITAILPEDKTYNVATITGKSYNVGGGVVTGVMTAGVNFLWQKQTYYIVQAQDTVAVQLPPNPANSGAIQFGWQLRPVLGSRTVSSGMRTLFVQLAFPPPVDANGIPHMFQDYGTVTVTTGWKKIDHKLNTVSTSVERTGTSGPFPISDFNLQPQITNVSPLDNGDGTVTVHLVSSSYLQNTYIKIAGTTISQGAPNVLFSPTNIDFTVPSTVLATQRAYLVDRSGANSEIVDPRIGSDANFACLAITGSPTVVPESPTTGRLTLGVAWVDGLNCLDHSGMTFSSLHPVVLVGGKVFGLRDAPITINDAHSTISFRAPLDLLRSAATVTVERLLWGSPYKVSADLGVTAVPTIDKATVIAKGKDNLEIALTGSNLQHLMPPAGMAFNADGKACTPNVPADDTSNTGRILCVPQTLAAKLTEVALKADSGDLLLVELPAPAKPEAASTKPSGPMLEPLGSIDEGVATTITVKGSELDSFEQVEVGKTKIPAELSADKGSIGVHLSANVVKAPKVVLVFFFKGSKNVSYTVTVNKKAAAANKQ